MLRCCGLPHLAPSVAAVIARHQRRLTNSRHTRDVPTPRRTGVYTEVSQTSHRPLLRTDSITSADVAKCSVEPTPTYVVPSIAAYLVLLHSQHPKEHAHSVEESVSNRDTTYTTNASSSLLHAVQQELRQRIALDEQIRVSSVDLPTKDDRARSSMKNVMNGDEAQRVQTSVMCVGETICCREGLCDCEHRTVPLEKAEVLPHSSVRKFALPCFAVSSDTQGIRSNVCGDVPLHGFASGHAIPIEGVDQRDHSCFADRVPHGEMGNIELHAPEKSADACQQESSLLTVCDHVSINGNRHESNETCMADTLYVHDDVVRHVRDCVDMAGALQRARAIARMLDDQCTGRQSAHRHECAQPRLRRCNIHSSDKNYSRKSLCASAREDCDASLLELHRAESALVRVCREYTRASRASSGKVVRQTAYQQGMVEGSADDGRVGVVDALSLSALPAMRHGQSRVPWETGYRTNGVPTNATTSLLRGKVAVPTSSRRQRRLQAHLSHGGDVQVNEMTLTRRLHAGTELPMHSRVVTLTSLVLPGEVPDSVGESLEQLLDQYSACGKNTASARGHAVDDKRIGGSDDGARCAVHAGASAATGGHFTGVDRADSACPPCVFLHLVLYKECISLDHARDAILHLLHDEADLDFPMLTASDFDVRCVLDESAITTQLCSIRLGLPWDRQLGNATHVMSSSCIDGVATEDGLARMTNDAGRTPSVIKKQSWGDTPSRTGASVWTSERVMSCAHRLVGALVRLNVRATGMAVQPLYWRPVSCTAPNSDMDRFDSVAERRRRTRRAGSTHTGEHHCTTTHGEEESARSITHNDARMGRDGDRCTSMCAGQEDVDESIITSVASFEEENLPITDKRSNRETSSSLHRVKGMHARNGHEGIRASCSHTPLHTCPAASVQLFAQYSILLRGVVHGGSASARVRAAAVHQPVPNFIHPAHFGHRNCPFSTFHIQDAMARGWVKEAVVMAVSLELTRMAHSHGPGGGLPCANTRQVQATEDETCRTGDPRSTDKAMPRRDRNARAATACMVHAHAKPSVHTWLQACVRLLREGETRAAVWWECWCRFSPPSLQQRCQHATAALMWNVCLSSHVNGCPLPANATTSAATTPASTPLPSSTARERKQCRMSCVQLRQALGLSRGRMAASPAETMDMVPTYCTMQRTPTTDARTDVSLGEKDTLGRAIVCRRPFVFVSGAPRTPQVWVREFAEPLSLTATRGSNTSSLAGGSPVISDACYTLASDMDLASSDESGSYSIRNGTSRERTRTRGAVHFGNRSHGVQPLSRHGRALVERLPAGLLAASSDSRGSFLHSSSNALSPLSLPVAPLNATACSPLSRQRRVCVAMHLTLPTETRAGWRWFVRSFAVVHDCRPASQSFAVCDFPSRRADTHPSMRDRGRLASEDEVQQLSDAQREGKPNKYEQEAEQSHAHGTSECEGNIMSLYRRHTLHTP